MCDEHIQRKSGEASWRRWPLASALEDEEVGDEVQSGREGEGEGVFHEEGSGEQKQDWAEQ